MCCGRRGKCGSVIDFIYDVLAGLCIIAGISAGALMWRNAILWRGRKLFLRVMSGTTCIVVAVTFAAMLAFDLSNNSYIPTLILRVAWLVMLALAASFSIADL